MVLIYLFYLQVRSWRGIQSPSFLLLTSFLLGSILGVVLCVELDT